MLAKYEDVRPKKDVKDPLKSVFMSAAYSEFFSVRGTNFSHIFQAYFFFERIILKHIENKNDCGGSRGRLPGKFLKIYVL